MDYTAIKKMITEEGKTLPLIVENQDGEAVFITCGRNEIGRYYQTRTAQNNGWERINIYYEDGTTEELYDK